MGTGVADWPWPLGGAAAAGGNGEDAIKGVAGEKAGPDVELLRWL